MLNFFFKFMDVSSFQAVYNSKVHEINFLILEKTFENFLKRRFGCLKKKKKKRMKYLRKMLQII